MATAIFTVYVAVLLIPAAICIYRIGRFVVRSISPVRHRDRLATVRQYTERAAYVDQPTRHTINP
jgi:hypothetical protein